MASEIELLVRVDDAGSSWASNIGCFRACTEGIARSIEVMMPCPWVPHAATLAQAHPEIDIGLHLTLTSEWDAIKWRPLTDARSLTDRNDHFHALLTPRDGDPRRSLMDCDWSLDEVERELRAQVDLGLRMFPHASHISCHMARHFRDVDPRIGDVLQDLCDTFELRNDPFGFGLPRFPGYPAKPRDAASRVDAFIGQLDALAPGRYIFIDHPAAPSGELAATGHPGYEDVQDDRVGCLRTLTDPRLSERIAELGIRLIGYSDL